MRRAREHYFSITRDVEKSSKADILLALLRCMREPIINANFKPSRFNQLQSPLVTPTDYALILSRSRYNSALRRANRQEIENRLKEDVSKHSDLTSESFATLRDIYSYSVEDGSSPVYVRFVEEKHKFERQKATDIVYALGGLDYEPDAKWPAIHIGDLQPGKEDLVFDMARLFTINTVKLEPAHIGHHGSTYLHKEFVESPSYQRLLSFNTK